MDQTTERYADTMLRLWNVHRSDEGEEMPANYESIIYRDPTNKQNANPLYLKPNAYRALRLALQVLSYNLSTNKKNELYEKMNETNGGKRRKTKRRTKKRLKIKPTKSLLVQSTP